MITMKQLEDLVREVRGSGGTPNCIVMHPGCMTRCILPPSGFEVDGERVAVRLDADCKPGKVYVLDSAYFEKTGDV